MADGIHITKLALMPPPGSSVTGFEMKFTSPERALVVAYQLLDAEPDERVCLEDDYGTTIWTKRSYWGSVFTEVVARALDGINEVQLSTQRAQRSGSKRLQREIEKENAGEIVRAPAIMMPPGGRQ